MSKMPETGEYWRCKPKRGAGTFIVGEVRGDRVTLRSAWSGKRKTISVRTLRSDYERDEAK